MHKTQRERLAAKVKTIVSSIRGRSLHERRAQREISLLLHPEISFSLVADYVGDPDPGVRRWSAGLLVKLDPEAAAPVLRPLLADADVDVRWIACELLDDVAGLWDLVRTGPYYLFERALERLTNLQLSGTAAKLAALLPEPNWSRSNRLCWAISRCGTGGAEALIELSSHPDAQTRANACLSLAAIGSAEAIEVLRERLDDVAEVASAAAIGLGRLGDAEAIPRLIELLTDEKVVYSAVTALGQLGADEVAPALIPLARHARVGRMVIEVLGKLTASDEIEDALIEIVEDFELDPESALEAARALGSVGSHRCVPALERLCQQDLRRLTKSSRKRARILPSYVARLRKL